MKELLIPNELHDINIFISATGDKNPNSMGTEVWITNIGSNKESLDLSKISLPTGWEYKEDEHAVFANPSVDTVEPLSLILQNNYEIVFVKHNWSGIIEISDKDNLLIREDLYDLNGDSFSFKLNNNIVQEIIPTYILLIIGCISLAFMIFYICLENIYHKKNLLYSTFSCLLIAIILDTYNKLYRYGQGKVIYIIVLYFIMYNIFFNAYKNILMQKYKNIKSIILFSITNLYISFSLFGESIFLPLGKVTINALDVLIFLLLSLSIFPFCFIMLYIFELIREHRFFYEKKNINSENKKISTNFKLFAIILSAIYVMVFSQPLFNIISYYVQSNWLSVIACFIIDAFIFLLLIYIIVSMRNFISEENFNSRKLFLVINLWNIMIGVLTLLIFNPGLMTADSFDQYVQAHSNFLNDHHSVTHTLLEKLLYNIWDSPYCIALAQIIMYSIVISSLVILLYKKRYNKKLLIFYVILNSIMINNNINIVTLWKDIAFSITLLWLTIICAKLIFEKQSFYTNIRNIIQFIVALCLVALLRHNGFVTYVGLVILLLISAFKYKSIKPLFICISSLLIVMSIKGPLFDHLNVIPNGSIASIIPIHGLSYVNYEGDNYLDKEAKQYLNSYMPTETFNELYHPYSANPFMYGEIPEKYKAMDKYREADLKEVVNLYIKSFLEKPFLIIKDRLYGTDLLWNVMQGNGYNYRCADFYNLNNNDLGIIHIDNKLTDIFFKALGFTANYKFIDMFIWRAGIYIDLLLLMINYLVANRKKRLIICMLPVILNTMSLFISMAWQDYRYVYYIFLCFGAIFLFTFYENTEEYLGERNDL
ncbi:MAG: DUF6020 family protein [Anaerocolumna aminovalerica]|uniref:DUF6020 family protein n=1 Tax=Anaerocolumna aminovalerica TaxID=1527 RepID=UPI0029154554|nr:DUF6020 family protein [Anaerocolumna aminovalerica]MDU6265991.1 DUF6020 family protein [Anaerocolumna aminovalerica]